MGFVCSSISFPTPHFTTQPQTLKSGQDYIIITIPRARRVHQSIFSTPPSALWSLFVCVYYLTIKPLLSLQTQTKMLTDVLILNGPGTCTMLYIAVLFNRVSSVPPTSGPHANHFLPSSWGYLRHALSMSSPSRVYARCPYRVAYFNPSLTGKSHTILVLHLDLWKM